MPPWNAYPSAAAAPSSARSVRGGRGGTREVPAAVPPQQSYRIPSTEQLHERHAPRRPVLIEAPGLLNHVQLTDVALGRAVRLLARGLVPPLGQRARARLAAGGLAAGGQGELRRRGIPGGLRHRGAWGARG